MLSCLAIFDYVLGLSKNSSQRRNSKKDIAIKGFKILSLDKAAFKIYEWVYKIVNDWVNFKNNAV